MPGIHTRQTTGTKAGKQNTPEADSASVSGVFFVCTDMKRSSGTRSLHPLDAVQRGLGTSPTSSFARGRKAAKQKWRRGTTRHCLPRLSPRYLFVVVGIFFVVNRRPLFRFAIYITALQAEHHIVSAFKKADVTFPAHAALAMLQSNKLLLHFPAATRAYLVGFTHSAYG